MCCNAARPSQAESNFDSVSASDSWSSSYLFCFLLKRTPSAQSDNSFDFPPPFVKTGQQRQNERGLSFPSCRMWLPILSHPIFFLSSLPLLRSTKSLCPACSSDRDSTHVRMCCMDRAYIQTYVHMYRRLFPLYTLPPPSLRMMQPRSISSPFSQPSMPMPSRSPFNKP